MIYPEFIKNGDYIGVTAPSDGVTDILNLKRLNKEKSKLQKLGLKVVETSNAIGSNIKIYLISSCYFLTFWTAYSMMNPLNI